MSDRYLLALVGIVAVLALVGAVSVGFHLPVSTVTGSASAPGSNHGYIDVANSERVAGWVLDWGDLENPLSIEIWVDGERKVARQTDILRPNLRAGGTQEYVPYGFNIPLDGILSPGDHEVVIKAVGHSTTILGRYTLSKPTPNIHGVVDLITKDRVRGWALDWNALDTPLTIEVSVDGSNVASQRTDILRADLDAGGTQTSIPYGFDIPLSLPEGTHRVSVKASSGGVSKELGATTIVQEIVSATISATPNPCEMEGGPCAAQIEWSGRGADLFEVRMDGKIVACGASGNERTDPVIGTDPSTLTVHASLDGTCGDLIGPPLASVEVVGKEPIAPEWVYLSSRTGQEVSLRFGTYGDVPVPADYDGDGKADPAVWHRYASADFRGPLSEIEVLRSSDKQSVTIDAHADPKTDLLVPADYDGDGKADVAFVRTDEDDAWHIYDGSGPRVVAWGKFFMSWQRWLGWWSGAPVPADYDGDGKADIATFQRATGKWFVSRSSGGGYQRLFGDAAGYASKDVGVPADYDGDGKADIALYRVDEGTWLIDGQGTKRFAKRFGTPLAADFDGDGKADPAFFIGTPAPSAQYMKGGLTNHPGYDYNVAIFKDDDGTYRMFWCGASPTGRLDAVYGATAKSPTGPFSTPRLIDDGGCDVDAIKIPGTMSDRCGGADVYYLYHEGDNYEYGINPDGSVKRVRELTNKVIAQYSCDATNWHRLGVVIGSSAPLGIGAYGSGHPGAIVMDGTVYLMYYNDTDAGLSGGRQWYATSTDGEHFTIRGPAAAGIGNKVRYLDDYGLFVGSASVKFKERLFFQQDLAYMTYFEFPEMYSSYQSLLAVPNQKACSVGDALLADPQGHIQGNTLYLYAGEYDTPTGVCDHANDPSFSIGTSEIYVSRIVLR